ncbi:succinate dehydrogenase assembly factor 2 [Phenylobacterium sp.]|uniref:FAD assembly factor SdhE n=1 Tax=Phenylobacterium sp. TaxID=1871053 RepID=UPI0025E0362D|nr:succinate dehydrogenase assembly factor 2 [Phenylobacterium sp.]
MTTDDARLKKLKLRAWRRGFREADLILGPFADKHVSTFSDAELDWFEGLLEQPDQDLYNWILEREATPAEFEGPLMSKLKAFRDEAYKGISPKGQAEGQADG